MSRTRQLLVLCLSGLTGKPACWAFRDTNKVSLQRTCAGHQDVTALHHDLISNKSATGCGVMETLGIISAVTTSLSAKEELSLKLKKDCDLLTEEHITKHGLRLRSLGGAERRGRSLGVREDRPLQADARSLTFWATWRSSSSQTSRRCTMPSKPRLQ
mmetsp:Transcript_95613/g.309727  ORF Transcript_95613/g.309727 Transcript_95613/m.309727 type:complete len:158 (+) Transcript_95613:96-569(+)